MLSKHRYQHKILDVAKESYVFLFSFFLSTRSKTFENVIKSLLKTEYTHLKKEIFSAM